jgi:hypothetical protein
VTSALESLHGVAQPRVEHRPDTAVDTLGPIAAELGEQAGVVLEPWQRSGLDMLLSTRADGKWTCYEYAEICSRRNGKTAMLLVRALFGFLLLGETPILWTAQEVKTSMRAWRDFRKMLWKMGTRVNDNLVDLGEGVQVRINASNGKEGFERVDTGQELRMVARSKDSGRGFDADFVVIDEAYDFTADQQDALAPTQIARPNAQVAYASSPPLSGIGSTSLYRLRDRAEAGGAARLGWRDWGRPESLDDVLAMSPRERRLFLDDQDVWASANPALGQGRVTLETLQNMRESMTDPGFAREVLGCWPKQIIARGDVIDPDVWRDRADPDSRPGDALVFALDASPGGRSAAIASSGRRDDELLHVKVVDYRPGTGWVVERVVELRDRWKPRKILLDPAGPAGALVADLMTAGVELEFVTGRDMAQACGALVNDLKEDRLRHCDQDALNDAVGQATSRKAADAWAWDRKDTTADICPLVAATVAAHGFRLFGAQEEVVPWVAWV